jgi:CBS domain-containing protein
MKISEIMTRDVEYIHADTPLKQAAESMQRLDKGFLPIGNSPQDQSSAW